MHLHPWLRSIYGLIMSFSSSMIRQHGCHDVNATWIPKVMYKGLAAAGMPSKFSA